MSQHRRSKKRKGGKRTVKLGIVPHTPTHNYVGVMIERGDSGGTVIAPDEARTIALQFDDDDPGLAAELRRLADMAEELVRLPRVQAIGDGVSIVPPKITGPHALQDWVRRWAETFREAYKRFRDAGVPLPFVVWATPYTESLDDPPEQFDAHDPDRSRERLAILKMTKKNWDTMPDNFYVVASRSHGRFKGTLVAILSAVNSVPPTSPENN
jgi:hypothetical protein